MSPKKIIKDYLKEIPGKNIKTEKIIKYLFFILMLLFIGIGFYTYFLFHDTSVLFDEVISLRSSTKFMNKLNYDYLNKYNNTLKYLYSKDYNSFDDYIKYDRLINEDMDTLVPNLVDLKLDTISEHLKNNIKLSSFISDSIVYYSNNLDSAGIVRLRTNADSIKYITESYNHHVLQTLGNILEKRVESRAQRLNDTGTSSAIMVILGTMTLTLSLFFFRNLIKSRNKAYNILKNSYRELDNIVVERTNELEKINKLLVNEIQNKIDNESLLKESEERFRTMAESAPVMIWMSDESKNINYANNGWLKFTGETMEETLSNDRINRIHPADVDRFMQVYNEAYEKKKSYNFEYRLKSSSDDYCWISERGTPRFHNKNFIGFIGICIDIQDMKRNENYLSLQYSVSKVLAEEDNIDTAMQMVLEDICKKLGWEFGILWNVDENVNALKAVTVVNNSQISEYNQLFDKEFLFNKGIGLPGLVWDSGKPLWVDEIKSSDVFIRTDAVNKMKFKSALGIPISNGSEVISVIEYFSTEKLSPNDDLLEVLKAAGNQIGIFIERVNAEEKLKESYSVLENRVKERTAELADTLAKLISEIEAKEKVQGKLKLFAHSIRSIKEAIYITDLNNNTIFVNEAFEEMLGFKEDEILNNDVPLYRLEGLSDQLIESIISSTMKGGWKGEFLTKKKDGTDIYIHLSTSVIKNEDGVIEAAIGVCQDITETKRSEALIEKRNSLLNLLNDIIKVTNKTFDINNAVTYAVNKICSYSSWDIGHCYYVKDDILISSKIWNEGFNQKFEKFREISAEMTFTTGEGIPGKCYDEARPIWIKVEENTDQNIFRRYNISHELGLQTGIWVPIIKQNEVVGIFEFFNVENKPLDYEILDCLDNIGIEVGNIFERVEILEKVYETQEKFQALAETANDAIITSNQNGEIIYVNKSATDIFGYTEEEFLKKTVELLISDDYKLSYKREFENKNVDNYIELSGKTLEMTGLRKDGNVFPIELSMASWYIEDDMYFTAMIKDISERKLIEKQLFEKQKMLEDAQKIAKLGSWDWDVVKDEINWSDELYRIYEIDRNKTNITFDEYSTLLHQDEKDNIRQIISNAFETKSPFSFYHKIFTKRGKFKILKSQGEVFVDENDKVVRMFGTTLDVTEVKEAENKLIESERKLKEAQHIAKLGSFEWDYKTGKISSSNELYNIFEIDPEKDASNVSLWMTYILPDDLKRVKTIRDNALKEKKPYGYTYRVKTGSGKIKHLSSQAKINLDNNGEILSIVGTIADITELKKAEESVVRSEKQLREAQRIAKLGSFEINYETKEVFWSEELRRIFELDYNESIPSLKELLNRIHQDDADVIADAIESQNANPRPVQITFRLIMKNRKHKYILLDAVPEIDKNKKLIRLYGSAQDITETKEKEQKLIISERQLREAQKIAKVGSWEINLLTGEGTWSDEMLRIYEIEPKETWMLKENTELRKLIHPEDVDIFDKNTNEFRKNMQPFQLTIRIITRSGKVKWLTTDTLVEYSKKIPVRIYGSVQDVTQKKEAEEIIRKSERQLKEAQKIAKLGSFEADAKTHQAEWSDEMFNIFELPKDNNSKSYNTIVELLHPKDRENYIEEIQKFLADPKPFRIKYRIITKSGKLKYLVSETEVDYDNNNKPLRFFGSLQDITSMMEAEETIRKSEKLLADAQRIAKLGSFEWDLITNDIIYTDEIFRIYEIDKNTHKPSMEDPFVRERMHPDDIQKLEELGMELLRTKMPVQVTFRYRGGNDQWKYLFVETLTQYDENNNPVRVYGSMQDITAIKTVEEELRKTNEKLIEAQQELIHNEKLAALGRFSSGIAHEIRNPLANISALAQLLFKSPLEPRLKKHLEFILKNVEIANKIIKDLLDFAQKDDSDFQEKNVLDILNNILDLVRTRCEANNIELIKNLDHQKFIMPVNEKKLHSSFMNFISNAIEAMPKGGKLYINSDIDEVLSKFIIEICDTGMGIPKENLDKIFEPFFTTKDTGSGLGMSIAYQGVQLHRGEININSEINKGTVIKIQFPINNN